MADFLNFGSNPPSVYEAAKLREAERLQGLTLANPPPFEQPTDDAWKAMQETITASSGYSPEEQGLFDQTGNLKGTTPEEWGPNIGTANVIASGLKGFGSLAQGWAALKQMDVAKDHLAENRRQYDQNYATQLEIVNKEYADRARSNRITGNNPGYTYTPIS